MSMFFLFLISPKCLGLNDRFTYEYARLRCLFSSILSISLLMVIAMFVYVYLLQ